jgi:hypothetical protein
VKLILNRRIWSQNTQRTAHWRTQRAERDFWIGLLIRELKGYRNPPPGKMRVRIKSFRVSPCHDTANLIGGCKEMVDALVRVGLLKDDSDQWASFEYAQEKVPRGQERTEIELEPVQELNAGN